MSWNYLNFELLPLLLFLPFSLVVYVYVDVIERSKEINIGHTLESWQTCEVFLEKDREYDFKKLTDKMKKIRNAVVLFEYMIVGNFAVTIATRSLGRQQFT